MVINVEYYLEEIHLEVLNIILMFCKTTTNLGISSTTFLISPPVSIEEDHNLL